MTTKKEKSCNKDALVILLTTLDKFDENRHKVAPASNSHNLNSVNK